MTAFLPRSPTPAQQVLVEQLRDGVVSRLILVGIEGAPAETLAAISKALAARLRQDSRFAAVNNGETGRPRGRRRLPAASPLSAQPPGHARAFLRRSPAYRARKISCSRWARRRACSSSACWRRIRPAKCCTCWSSSRPRPGRAAGMACGSPATAGAP
ncbi:MAG: hypothetical protein MZW92_37895 [Comamonadaceae bacterium]|nr:hypothetical protein [Comamonadaceae bacterium]